MATQYRIIDLDNPDDVSEPFEGTIEHAKVVLSLNQQDYPWPDRIILQKRQTAPWETL
jgi:hypothetical protein